MKENVICAWCKTPMYFDERIAENMFSHAMCKSCEQHILEGLIGEDYRFDPTQGGDTVALDPHYGMSKLKRIDDKDDAMPHYKHTRDASTELTQDMRDEYTEKNAKNSAMKNIPMGM